MPSKNEWCDEPWNPNTGCTVICFGGMRDERESNLQLL